MLRSLIESGLVPVVDLREIFRQVIPLLPAVLEYTKKTALRDYHQAPASSFVCGLGLRS